MIARPGLAKTHRSRALHMKARAFVRLLDGAVRDWLETADVMSEGREEPTSSGLTYFGSTSILLPWDRVPDPRFTYPSTLPVLASDPHLRIRITRIARREAESRASADLDSMHVEITCRGTSRGLLFAVDLEARVRTAGFSSAR
ncbi:MAG: hypothetical protein U0271_25725 [Polyangiaceae bacterium]